MAHNSAAARRLGRGERERRRGKKEAREAESGEMRELNEVMKGKDLERGNVGKYFGKGSCIYYKKKKREERRREHVAVKGENVQKSLTIPRL